MAKSYTYLCKVSNIKYTILGCVKRNKFLIIISLFLGLIGLLTGIFVAIKCGITTATLSDYNLTIYSCNEYADFGAFISRIFSYLCLLAILTVTSLNVVIVPIGLATLTYRAYLIGFNVTLLIVLYGFTGAFTSLIIIFPIQIVSMLILVAYFVVTINSRMQKKRYGKSEISLFKTFLISFGLLILLSLIETLLLIIFKASNILVI